VEQLARASGNEGAMLISGYELLEKPVQPEYWHKIVRNFRPVDGDELRQLGFGKFSAGMFFTTFTLQPSIYLKHLLEKFQAKGGKLIKQNLKSLDDINGKYDVIVNCCGLGSRALFQDSSIYPIRGQVIRATSPNVNHFYMFADDYYILPNRDFVVIGGTHDVDQWDCTVNPAVAEHIWKMNTELVPSLKTAQIVEHRVGLRPARPTVRLELEQRVVQHRKVPVVHNYGQGGSGITLFYGCAKDAAELVEQAVQKLTAKL